jgi:hypothetical protein
LGQNLGPIKKINKKKKKKYQSDDACHAVSVNLIFPINYDSDIPNLKKKIYCGKGLHFFSLCALKFIGVNDCNRVPSNRSILSSDMTRAKYYISIPPLVETENVISRTNPNNVVRKKKNNK